MPVYINAAYTTGKTLFATIKRLSDGYRWSVAASAFQAAPTLENSKISLAEGSSEYAGSYTGSVSSLISPGEVSIFIHDDGLAGDTVVAASQAYVSVSDERAPADLLRWKGSTPSDIHFTGSVQSNVVYWQGTATATDAGLPSVNTTSITTNAVSAGALADSARDEIRNAITGGAYALQTDASGYVKISSGTGTGQVSLTSGVVSAAVASLGANVITAASLASDAGAEIADAVWDEALAGHAGAGSAGEALSAAGGGASAGDIADAVWDELTAGHTTADTFGKLLNDYLDAAISTRLATAGYTAPPSAASVADAVWDEATSGHTTAGTAGKLLIDIGTNAATAAALSPPTATAIADAVLSRNVSNVEGSAPTTSLAFLVLANTESLLAETLWTVYRTDGSTTFATRTIGRTAGAVTSIS